MLSTSIYDLVLIYVCHFHHHHRRNGCSTFSSIEILVRLSWIPASKEFAILISRNDIQNSLDAGIQDRRMSISIELKVEQPLQR